jgi:NAD(P)-dependent dehydrogenase (short-subunit alcohol dehydrogenase family)
VIVKHLDLSSLKSVRTFAEDILRTEQKLHVLIHNAGYGGFLKKAVSVDGIEMTMATNHYGPFLLTHLLIDLLKSSEPSRVVVVASSLYFLASIDLKNLNPVDALPAKMYYVSKSANILFTYELARRLNGTKVTANCLHPGLIDSGIWRNVPSILKFLLRFITGGFGKNFTEGSYCTVYAAVDPALESVSGKYFFECKEKDCMSSMENLLKAKQFWEGSIKMVKLEKNDLKI